MVERSFNVLKQWRALATRYDKLALTYRGGVVLGAIIIWLRRLGDTPLVSTRPWSVRGRQRAGYPDRSSAARPRPNGLSASERWGPV